MKTVMDLNLQVEMNIGQDLIGEYKIHVIKISVFSVVLKLEIN